MSIRRKIFIAYHHDDQKEVDKFIEVFDDKHDIFISRALGMTEDIINSTDTDYVMQRIRELYLKDTTVTIVLIGACTWARRYIDWEIQASLRHGDVTIPNGLIGIKLPSFDNKNYPNRLNLNLLNKEESSKKDCYARVYPYPNDKDTLQRWIEEAYEARTKKANLIVNPKERFENNRTC